MNDKSLVTVIFVGMRTVTHRCHSMTVVRSAAVEHVLGSLPLSPADEPSAHSYQAALTLIVASASEVWVSLLRPPPETSKTI